MRHIFVSYCHEDADFAQILEGRIRESGFAIWRDLNLIAGSDWQAGIDGAAVMIDVPASSYSAL